MSKKTEANLLPVRIYGDAILRQKATEVETLTDEIKVFIRDLTYTMYERDGVGLAAPQVGKSWRIFVCDPFWGHENTKREPLVFINPRFLLKEGDYVHEEGCISIPGIFEKVKRFGHVILEGMDENGETRQVEANDMFAVVLQHEYDHLDGILFIDYVPKLRLWPLKPKLRTMASTTTESGENIRA